MKPPPAQLQVCSGVHTGARSELARGQRLSLGSAEDCDIRLLDEGIAARHLELEPRARRLRLRALAPGVRVRDRELRQGRRATLRNGDQIQVAAVALRYDHPAASRWPALRWPWPPRWRIERSPIAWVLGSAALGSFTVAIWPGGEPVDHRDAAQSAEAGVRREIDARSGRVVYRGIVEDERTLGLLRARLRRQEEAPALLRVAVRSRILQTLDEVLGRHYGVSRVSELRPGHYRVVTGGPACHLDDIAWDTAAVTREARDAVGGIDTLEFRQDPALLVAAAPVPLSAPRWTLVSTPRGQWIADGTARRYFEGGQLAEGQVIDMARCSVRLVDRPRKRFIHYSAEAGHGACY